jgi:hypothetical protein
MNQHDVLTVDFFPEIIPFPKFTQEAYLRQTAEDMLHLLKAQVNSPTATPLTFGPPILNAFAKVANILGRAIAPLPTAPLQPTEETVHPVPLPIAPIRLTPPRVLIPPSSVVAPLRVPIVTPASTPVPPAPTTKPIQKSVFLLIRIPLFVGQVHVSVDYITEVLLLTTFIVSASNLHNQCNMIH